jgi:hypothetical protein
MELLEREKKREERGEERIEKGGLSLKKVAVFLLSFQYLIVSRGINKEERRVEGREEERIERRIRKEGGKQDGEVKKWQ